MSQPEPLPHQTCPVCRGLHDEEYACQKYGWEENDTHLPAAAGALLLVRDLAPYSSRKKQLLHCPECGTYYLYSTDYTYLVNGTEDEEWLTRLKPGEEEAYLVA